MTHSIGSGTVNLTINIPTDERGVLGRAAAVAGARSVGDYCKRLMLRGLESECPDTAIRVREIRRQYYGLGLLLLIGWTVAQSWLTHDDETMSRARRGVRVERSARRNFEDI